MFQKPLRNAIRLEAKMQGIAEDDLVQRAIHAYISESRFDRVERLLESAHASSYQDRKEYQYEEYQHTSTHTHGHQT